MYRENIATTCQSCGAPLAGYAGDIIKCSYCGTDNALKSENSEVYARDDTFCVACGSPMADNADFCPNCGRPVNIQNMRINANSSNELTPEQIANRDSILALVCGLIGIFAFSFMFVLVPVLGILAISRSKRAKKLGYSGWRTVIATFLGIVEIVIVVVIVLVFCFFLGYEIGFLV